MPQRAMTNSSEADILGSNSPKRNPQTGIIPIVKLSIANDFNEEESDLSYDDRTVFCKRNITMATNRDEESEDTVATVKKTPLFQAMSTGSDTSTASSESWDLDIGNRKSSIRSLTCSESDSEDGPKVVADLAEILGNIRVTEGDNDEKTASIFPTTAIANLSIETSKLNLNYEVDNAKYLTDKESTLSTNKLNDIHRNYNFDVSNGNEDSESSNEASDSDSEDDDTYVTRGRGRSSAKTTYRSMPYNFKPEENQQNDDYLLNATGPIYSQYYRKLDPILDKEFMNEIQAWFPTAKSSKFKTSNVDLPSISIDKINDKSWTLQPNLTDYPSHAIRETTVQQPISSTSNQSDGFAFLSDPFRRQESCHMNLNNTRNPTADNVKSLRRTSYNSEGSVYTTESSDNFSLVSWPSPNGEINALSNMGQFADFHSALMSETNESETSETMGNPNVFTPLEISLENDLHFNNPCHSSTLMLGRKNNDTNSTFATASPDSSYRYSSQTAVMNVLESPTNPVYDVSNISNEFNLLPGNNMHYINACNTISPIQNQPSNTCLLLGTATATEDLLNPKNLTGPTISSPSSTKMNKKSVTVNINTSLDSKGFVTVADHDSIHEPFIHSTNNIDFEGNITSLELDVDGIQDPMVSTNNYEDERTRDFRPNIAQQRSPCNGQIQQISSNAIVSSSSIPTSVNEKRTTSKKNEQTIHTWKLLKMSSSSAYEELKKSVNEPMVYKVMKKMLQCDNKYFKIQDYRGDTHLMSILRDPKILVKNLHILTCMVQRMVRIPESFMKTDNQGRDALYLAAVHCPKQPYVAGVLADTIAALRKHKAIQLNTYNYKTFDTLMHVVAAQGDTHVDVMNHLLAVRKTKNCSLFDPSIQNSEGKTPLHLAVEAHGRDPLKKSVEMVRLLVHHGANSCLQERKSGDTALHIAISHVRSRAIVQALLDSRVDCTSVRIQNYAGNLPIHLAASDLNSASLETQVDVCRRLVDYGSPTNMANNQYKMPLALVAPERKDIMKNIFHKK